MPSTRGRRARRTRRPSSTRRRGEAPPRMLAYLVRRLILAVLTTWAVSVLAYVVIQLPPGDYITSYIAQMSASGSFVTRQEAEALRQEYGLDKPIWVQSMRWLGMGGGGRWGV